KASRSTALCTATVVMPMALAVRMMRQAISPRLATSSVVIISLFLDPVGGTFFQEGADAFPALCTGADLHNALLGVMAQLQGKLVGGGRMHQGLAGTHGLGAVLQ